MKLVLYFIIIFLNLSLFSGCDYIKEKKDILKEKITASEEKVEDNPDAEIIKKIEELATKVFPDSPILQKEWVDKQYGAYCEFSRFIPDMPLNEYTALRERAEAKYPNDYVMRLKYLSSQADGYYHMMSLRSSFIDQQWEHVYRFAEKNAPDDYNERTNIIHEWKHTLAVMSARKTYFSEEEMNSFFDKLYNEFSHDPRKFAEYLERCAVAKYRFDRYFVTGVKKDLQDGLKAEIQKMSDLSYQERYEKLQEVIKIAKANPDATLESLLGKQPLKIEKSLQAKAEEIFRQSIFTKHGPDEEIYTAALVKMNGKMVVLSTKHFIPEKWPVVFANSRGKIVCSKGYISDSHPMILLIPDKEPIGFTPIEVVSKEDSLKLFDRPLFMIAPSRGGFASVPVSVFSEDNDFLNLTSATAPHTSYKTSIKSLGRSGLRLLVSIIESIDVGENSVVIDSETGKLVSMAIRSYNPGVLSHFGKTGNVIGHENFAIPDYATFVRQFDGTVNKTEAPRSAIKFVRITAFESWKPLNIEKFQEQKNEVRMFTDENNDFMMFFKSNSFREALHSRRLAKIAVRYQRPLLIDSITQESYERYYRNYMIDVSYAIKRRLVGNKDVEDFYSIYKQEYKYQYRLREAMYRYISEGLENKDIINIIHTDLRTRYNNCNYNGGRIGGSIGGGY